MNENVTHMNPENPIPHYHSDPNEEPIDGTTDKETRTREASEETGKVVLIKDDPELDRFLNESMENIEEIQRQVKALNAEKKAIVESVEAKGLNRHAFKEAMRYKKMDDSQRQGYDLSLKMARRASGNPIQSDLF